MFSKLFLSFLAFFEETHVFCPYPEPRQAWLLLGFFCCFFFHRISRSDALNRYCYDSALGVGNNRKAWRTIARIQKHKEIICSEMVVPFLEVWMKDVSILDLNTGFCTKITPRVNFPGLASWIQAKNKDLWVEKQKIKIACWLKTVVLYLNWGSQKRTSWCRVTGRKHNISRVSNSWVSGTSKYLRQRRKLSIRLF